MAWGWVNVFFFVSPLVIWSWDLTRITVGVLIEWSSSCIVNFQEGIEHDLLLEPSMWMTLLDLSICECAMNPSFLEKASFKTCKAIIALDGWHMLRPRGPQPVDVSRVTHSPLLAVWTSNWRPPNGFRWRRMRWSSQWSLQGFPILIRTYPYIYIYIYIIPRNPVVPSQKVPLDPPNLPNRVSNHLLRRYLKYIYTGVPKVALLDF